ncbi:hypothetical protein GBA52_028908 [Prunus armeniaca]|nr:hypothetical protein GBA52_028908 [Prunus armeniaca]
MEIYGSLSRIGVHMVHGSQNGSDSVMYYVPYLFAIQLYVDPSKPSTRIRYGEMEVIIGKWGKIYIIGYAIYGIFYRITTWEQNHNQVSFHRSTSLAWMLDSWISSVLQDFEM